MTLPDWNPHATLEPLCLPWLTAAGLQLAVLRLDALDPLVSGNKWFKLAPYLAKAARDGAEGVISLGGAHSNHLHALAAAGARFGFPTVGLLRGEAQDTPTVRDLQHLGMQLHWLGYGGYRARHKPGFWDAWLRHYPHYQPIPEGGGGLMGAQGCVALVGMIRQQLSGLGWDDYHSLWTAAGTGTTLAGLVLGEAGDHPVIGALAVPPDHGVADQVSAILAEAGRADRGYRLIDASRGGFARVDAVLARFLLDSERDGGLELEPLYTAKALLAIHDEAQAGRIPGGSRLVLLHTGGLQGRRALHSDLLRLAGYTDRAVEAQG
ncbi:1-aminocyclopropane-1-carboxylate deaminase/D-cysteine desulfhydrase [Metapseudomonas resinovorans]|uniref:1-aminocyclopropane-1-carboxylate deaminase/D-cysteine desulfhydrase n=1 Tax=Metapseudomonas resinovorans TaxID=53412 RepID=UPI0018FE5159|nr:pyridoxal-phosphate dependent enzyme [Pseudomonas resinovorans]